MTIADFCKLTIHDVLKEMIAITILIDDDDDDKDDDDDDDDDGFYII